MNGNVMYDVARLRVADMQRAAQRARKARDAREARRGRRARVRALETVPTPVIPDFAEEMFAATGDAVPEGSPKTTRGRHARSDR
jgi:hypothetical protein